MGDLASTLANPEMVAMLENGKSVQEIIQLSKPIDERLRDGLAQVREIQSSLLSGITEEQVLAEIAEPLLELASKNKRTAQEIEKKLKETVNPESDDEG